MSRPEDYTVAMIFALEIEFTAVRSMLDKEYPQLPPIGKDPNKYFFGELSGHKVVLTVPTTNIGINAIAAVATHVQWSFPHIDLRMLVGVAGGIPSTGHDVRLGDVVISMPSDKDSGVVRYDLNHAPPLKLVHVGQMFAPPKVWRDAVKRMRADNRTASKISQHVSEVSYWFPRADCYQRPRQASDVLFDASFTHVEGERTCRNCDQRGLVNRAPRVSKDPAFHYGLIASGNRVIKDPHMRDYIGRDCDGALCFEMEAAGVMNNFRCIVIRGIADYSDAHKNKIWQGYAAATAAGCAKELLTYIPR